jgi:hypothetical protein
MPSIRALSSAFSETGLVEGSLKGGSEALSVKLMQEQVLHRWAGTYML